MIHFGSHKGYSLHALLCLTRGDMGRRHEAQRLPDVVTSGIDPRAYDARRTAYAPAAEVVPRAPDFARPSRQWLREFLADFQSVREHLARRVISPTRRAVATADVVVMDVQPANPLTRASLCPAGTSRRVCHASSIRVPICTTLKSR